MHIIIALALLILGYAAGQNISWLIGTPMLCLGLYMFVVGDTEWRERQEGLLTLLGLFCGVGLLIAGFMGW